MFLGQEDASYSLISSLSRYLRHYMPHASEWLSREERALRIFRRKAHNFLEDSSVLGDDLRYLALMQHHGSPTKMVDFTKSPFVATFLLCVMHKRLRCFCFRYTEVVEKVAYPTC